MEETNAILQGEAHGLSDAQKALIYKLALNVVQEVGGPENISEETYTARAFAMGRSLKDAFGGWWACVCALNSPSVGLSYAVRATKHACFVVHRRHFFFVAQTYDPLAPVVETDEWNLS